MYAIVETGGKQYRVQPGDTISVERLPGEPGEMLELGPVLLVAGDGEQARVGTPTVPGAVVQAEVVEHRRGDKIIVFRFKSKVRYRRKTGHRQALTRLRITDILLDGQSTAGRARAGDAEAPTPQTRAQAPARRRRAATAASSPQAEPEPEVAPVAESSTEAAE
jgi:large subunit ribosomal protein L21